MASGQGTKNKAKATQMAAGLCTFKTVHPAVSKSFQAFPPIYLFSSFFFFLAVAGAMKTEPCVLVTFDLAWNGIGTRKSGH
jgi:hypothetical protein